MRIWIDLGNSPHVPFFRALLPEFERRGHEVLMTARAFAQTVELAKAAGMSPTVIGGHGGRKLPGKAWNLLQRGWALARWARGHNFDLAVSHNSHEHLLAARLLGLRSVTLMDYEYHPANHFSFRIASRVIVPDAFPDAALRRLGAREAKVRRYHGTKEDVYLADFEADPNFGRAYSGWATSEFRVGHEDQAAELYKRAFAHMDRMTEREKYRTLGGYYLGIATARARCALPSFR